VTTSPRRATSAGRASRSTKLVASQATPAPERTRTSDGRPRAVSKRAIERGNLVVAEVTAGEIGRLDLVEALELTALVAKRDPKRHPRYAARRLWRYLGESETVTIDDAVVAGGLLLALGGKRHDEAFLALLGMAEQASGDRSPTALR
jgi:hypothetical protein